jgi:hypothetical protein
MTPDHAVDGLMVETSVVQLFIHVFFNLDVKKGFIHFLQYLRCEHLKVLPSAAIEEDSLL